MKLKFVLNCVIDPTWRGEQVRRLANSDDEFIEKHNLILPEEIARLLTRRQRRDVCKSILINRPDIPADELFKFKDDLPYIEKFANVLPLDVSKFLFADERRQVVACMLWKKSGWMSGPLREGGEHSVEQSAIDELGKRDPFDFRADQEYIQQVRNDKPKNQIKRIWEEMSILNKNNLNGIQDERVQ